MTYLRKHLVNAGHLQFIITQQYRPDLGLYQEHDFTADWAFNRIYQNARGTL